MSSGEAVRARVTAILEDPAVVAADVEVLAWARIVGVVRNARLARRMTMRTLAQTSGLDIGLIRSFERGCVMPLGTADLASIMAALGLSRAAFERDEDLE